MRFLHTSDWHLGARLCDRERVDEFSDFLQWMTQTLEKEKIDLLLICGDIFDSSNPPNSAESLYFDFLCSVKSTGCRHVVIIGGNHDSVSKLNSSQSILKYLNIHVIGGASESIEDMLIPLKDINGNLEALICAVPFLRERDLRNPVPGESWQEREIGVAQEISNYYGSIRQSAEKIILDKDIPLIALGHLFVVGSQTEHSERDLYVGNLGAINASIFSEDFSYVALGHIHKKQILGTNSNIQYCGSPIALDFGEDDHKTVIIGNFEGHHLNKIESIEVPIFRKLIRFLGTFDEVLQQIEAFEPPESFWAEAVINNWTNAKDLNLLMSNAIEEKNIELLRIKVQSNSGENIMNQETLSDIKDLDVIDVFREKCVNSGLDHQEIDELLPLYKELLVTIHED